MNSQNKPLQQFFNEIDAWIPRDLKSNGSLSKAEKFEKDWAKYQQENGIRSALRPDDIQNELFATNPDIDFYAEPSK